MVRTASAQTTARLNSAKKVLSEQAIRAHNKVIDDILAFGRGVDSKLTTGKVNYYRLKDLIFSPSFATDMGSVQVATSRNVKPVTAADNFLNAKLPPKKTLPGSSGSPTPVEGASLGKGIDNAKDITKLTVDDIPTAKSGNFNKFFNSLTRNELDELWKDKRIRKKIERQLREPGGLHEWHLVSRAPQFKHWNTSAEEIKDLRTAISDVKFVNPNGVHGGLGSTKAHNELLAIIDTSSDYATFVRRLNNWANYRLEGGVPSLPEGLRLK
ncbi:hypothetical protein BTS2_2004 [Bacillus sp. TS-2]|nr:hypothetical protein BTS2_2004 [Bacillus sp. TS-2]